LSTLSTFDSRLSTLLAIDTATDRPTLALGTAAEPGVDTVIAHRRDLSRDIDLVVRALLATRGIDLATLAGVLIADGPGSFTGLRIGAAFAKGLCRAAGLRLWSAPSLLGAARAVAATGDVVAEYDALRGEVYRAAYRFGPGGITSLEAAALVAAPSALAGNLSRGAGELDASAAALLSLVGMPGGPALVPDPAGWEPAYGRLAEAEVRLRARGASGA
jgi:tRNA threonylcarbamoyl adenosine modification protein YeaZ